MTLAPIRGAPPGAPNPDFPIDEPRMQPAEATEVPPNDQPPTPPVRYRHTPIEICGGGITLTFTVIPELPAIARARVTIHAVADSGQVAFLQMSDTNARRFLTDIRDGRSPVVATGDEDGTVEIEFEITEAQSFVLARARGEQGASHRWVFDQSLDLKAIADELLADLGA